MTIRELELQLTSRDIIFAFSGSVSYAMLSNVSGAVKEELEKNEGSNKELYNVYYIFVELLQNIMNYSSKRIDDQHKGSGTCFVTQDKKTKKYSVCSGNMIDSSDIEMIKKKLDKINSLNPQELRAYFREVRKDGRDVHEKGAGLGFIEIARKADGKLKYDITPIDENSAYFEIHVNI